MIKEKLEMSSRFLDAHNELENFMRKNVQNNNHLKFYELVDKSLNNPIIKRYQREIKSFGNLRNSIVHTMNYKQEKVIAEPHEGAVIEYENIVREVMNPPLALNTIAVKYDQIEKFTLDDKVQHVLKIMREKSFTQVPITNEDGVLQGVFSENTLASYLSDYDLIIDKENSTLREFSDFMQLDKHSGEYYRFESKGKNIYDIKDVFSKHSFKNNKILAAIFITNTGKKQRKYWV